MKYLIPKFDCKIVGECEINLFSEAKYQIEDFSNFQILLSKTGETYYIDLNQNKYLLLVKYKQDDFYFLFQPSSAVKFCTNIKFQNKIFLLSLNNEITLSCDGSIFHECKISDLEYSHCEFEENLCYIYFSGKRNFVIILNQNEVLFSDFYDEFNKLEKEKYYLCRLYDGLNHGRVCHVNNNEVESYLVYLDDYDLNLTDDFVGNIFLDCFLAGNFKYCNELLTKDLKLEKAESVKEFFENFDTYYPLDKNIFALIKKNTLAGIYHFEVNNKSISNIIHL